jgi:hypothetical protein
MKLIFSMEDLAFVMAICVSNVMATTMGRLAIEIVDSVCEYRETGISNWFCGKCKYSTKKKAIYCIFSYNMIIALVLLCYSEISLAGWGHESNLDCRTVETSRWFN